MTQSQAHTNNNYFYYNSRGGVKRRGGLRAGLELEKPGFESRPKRVAFTNVCLWSFRVVPSTLVVVVVVVALGTD